jgi:hypothetical protein
MDLDFSLSDCFAPGILISGVSHLSAANTWKIKAYTDRSKWGYSPPNPNLGYDMYGWHKMTKMSLMIAARGFFASGCLCSPPVPGEKYRFYA